MRASFVLHVLGSHAKIVRKKNFFFNIKGVFSANARFDLKKQKIFFVYFVI